MQTLLFLCIIACKQVSENLCFHGITLQILKVELATRCRKVQRSCAADVSYLAHLCQPCIAEWPPSFQGDYLFLIFAASSSLTGFPSRGCQTHFFQVAMRTSSEAKSLLKWSSRRSPLRYSHPHHRFLRRGPRFKRLTSMTSLMHHPQLSCKLTQSSHYPRKK